MSLVWERYVDQLPHWPKSGKAHFSRNSMNFLWMMFRSGWGTKTDQETTLALRIATLRKLNDEWLVLVEDVSALVAKNRRVSKATLMTPRERVYPVSAPVGSAS